MNVSRPSRSFHLISHRHQHTLKVTSGSFSLSKAVPSPAPRQLLPPALRAAGVPRLSPRLGTGGGERGRSVLCRPRVRLGHLVGRATLLWLTSQRARATWLRPRLSLRWVCCTKSAQLINNQICTVSVLYGCCRNTPHLVGKRTVSNKMHRFIVLGSRVQGGSPWA